MTEKDTRQISNALQRKLSAALKKLDKGADPEDVHRFRVACKKLRAFCSMLSFTLREDHTPSLPEKIKKVYTITGSIRDLQLQLSRVEGIPRTTPYARLISGALNRLVADLASLLPVKFHRNQFPAPVAFPLSAFRAWAKIKLTAVRMIVVSGAFSDRNIHAIRKILKALDYNLSHYTGLERTQLEANVWKGNTPVQAAALLEQLGSYQDQCTAVALLKSAWLQAMPAAAGRQLILLKQQWIKDKLQQKKRLVQQLRELYSRK